MGRERRRNSSIQQIQELNLTPLIDIIFLLLIAFIIAFPLVEQGIHIQLPKGNAAKLEDKKSQSISIKYLGGVFLNDKSISEGELEDELKKLALEDPQPPVLIRCDERVEYGELVKTLRLLHRAKITRMALVTEPTK